MLSYQLFRLFVELLTTYAKQILVVVVAGRVHETVLASFHINPSDIWIVGVYLLSFLADRSVGEVLNVILGSNEDSSFGLDFLGPDGPERRYSIKEEAHLHFVCVFKHFQAYSCAQGKTDKDYFVASCSHIIDQGEEYLSYFLVVQRAQVSGIVVLTL